MQTSAAIVDLVTRAATQLAPTHVASEPARIRSLVRYLETLTQWSAHTDLAGARDVETLVDLALGDALVMVEHARDGIASPLWEVGAGGASLLVPLALCIENLHGVMFEPRQKRATFLRAAVGSLGLASRVRVEQSRLERPVPNAAFGAPPSCVLGRAVLTPKAWTEFAQSLLATQGGSFALLLAEHTTDLPRDGVIVRQYALPHSGKPRSIVWHRVEPSSNA